MNTPPFFTNGMYVVNNEFLSFIVSVTMPGLLSAIAMTLSDMLKCVGPSQQNVLQHQPLIQRRNLQAAVSKHGFVK